ncbi:hypothetical protein JOC95_001744 [Bacillus tianshenii]|uniref:Uncharacterized protein n=1 Tax=Sutcliffiella tianshenii TaxID=1463404 RepID=A0ABS2NZQ6_9BACI|nr:hypothetical protein [Bacillus tianshenii]MBM7619892.1 hypothetical protein [Bacillus tianshenii]
MEFNLNIHLNGLEMIFVLLGWGIVFFFFYRIYKNQEKDIRPKLWKGILAIIIGLFAFTFPLTFFQPPISIAILPLGVWILYALRKGKWEVYRKYAWLGFGANYILLATTLIGIFFHGIIYPKDQAATFISEAENASLHIIHPSAQKADLNHEAFEQALDIMQKSKIDSHRLYNSIVLKEEKVERFPYILSGTKSQIGSGLNTQVYVERDGKGVLITSDNQRQYYFRSEQSFLKMEGGGTDE